MPWAEKLSLRCWHFSGQSKENERWRWRYLSHSVLSAVFYYSSVLESLEEIRKLQCKSFTFSCSYYIYILLPWGLVYQTCGKWFLKLWHTRVRDWAHRIGDGASNFTDELTGAKYLQQVSEDLWKICLFSFYMSLSSLLMSY